MIRILCGYYAGPFPAYPVLQELKRLGYDVQIKNSCYIHEVRNRLVSGTCQEITQSHPDGFTVFVDADMVLTVSDVEALLKRAQGLDIVVVPYRTQLDNGIDCCDRQGGSGLVPVERGGLGLAAINNRVFNKLEYPYFEHYTMKVGNCAEVVGEDIYFCEKARAAGFKIYADYDIKIDHQIRKGVKMEQQTKTYESSLATFVVGGIKLFNAMDDEYQAIHKMLVKTLSEKKTLEAEVVSLKSEIDKLAGNTKEPEATQPAE